MTSKDCRDQVRRSGGKSCTCPDMTKSKLKPLDASKCRRMDSSSTVQKLAELVSDPVSSANTPRILHYLNDVLSTTEDGFYVKDLDSIMSVVEFLALNSRRVGEYREYLDQMLALCCTPPLLTKTSEGLFCSEVLERYFTLLGYLLVILPTVREILVVHETIRRLLDRTRPGHIAAVKLELCRRAVEASILPVVVTEILEIVTIEMFQRTLETALLLVSATDKCCYKMLEVGLLDHILVRLDPEYATRSRFEIPAEIPEDELDRDHSKLDTLVTVTNIMWKIIHSVMPPKMLSNDKMLTGFEPPSQFTMWSLRYAFKREVRCAGRNQSSMTMRNDLAAIILASLATFPGWKFVECGLAYDLVVLSVASEVGMDDTWASGVRLGNSIEDLRFKKILLLIVCHLAKIGACVEIMKQRRLLFGILTLVNPDMGGMNLCKNEGQFWELHPYALHALSVLLPLMPEEFIKHRGTNRLLMILEWAMLKEFDSQLILNCVKTINYITMSGKEIILKEFRAQGAIATLIKLVHFVLSVTLIKSQHQRILTHAMMILETLVKNERRCQTLYGEQSVKMVLKILQRFLYDKLGYFKLDNRLAIAVGTYIWECIVWCPTNLKMFVERGAIFVMLDVIDATIFPVRVIFLGALCDLCEDGLCETQLCTWRGENKELGLISLLARIWREEEIRIGAKRTKDGCIDDLELPLMGPEQWFQTFYTDHEHTTSPALTAMMGSCLPKIYGIRKILERNSERYEIAKNHYKILLQQIPAEDRITMLIVDHYFRLKQGQVWVEIQRGIHQIGVLPLRIDGEMIALMLQSHHQRSMFVKTKQEAILKESNDADIREEKATYKEIIDSKLAPTLDAFHEVDYIARTTDPRFMRQGKQNQTTEVDRALKFPENVKPQLCHRTFLRNTNVTAIMDHQHSIQSELGVHATGSGEYKLAPVSSTDSGFEVASLMTVDGAGDALPCRACFASGLPCFHR